MMPDISIVVVTHNSEGMIGQLIESIPAACAGLSAEIIVVDNDSTDETRRVVAEFDDITLISAANDGYSAGINRGVREAQSSQSAILVLNPDVRLDPNSVKRMFEKLRPNIGIVAPLIRDGQGELHLSLRREPTLSRALGLGFLGTPHFSEYVREPDSYTTGHAVDWALGAILLISRSCFNAVGGWDESYFLYSEETDFCLNAKSLGYATWFEPSATAIHIGAQSGQSDATHAMQIVNRVRLYARRHPPTPSYIYFGLTVLSEISWIVRGHRQSRNSVTALLVPSARPPQLGVGNHLLPR